MICTECGSEFVPSNDEEDVCETCQLEFAFGEELEAWSKEWEAE